MCQPLTLYAFPVGVVVSRDRDSPFLRALRLLPTALWGAVSHVMTLNRPQWRDLENAVAEEVSSASSLVRMPKKLQADQSIWR